jgi:hypothetical protein
MSKEKAPRGWSADLRHIVLLSLGAMLLHSGIRRRGQHPKQHGTVRATFEVLDDIPATYKVGLFAKPATYHAVIRFSNGPQTEDRQPGPQGMAIKLVGVPGRKVLDAEANAGTHDFILIDGPVFFVRNMESYARLFRELSRLPPGATPTKWRAWLQRNHPDDIPVVENYHNRVVDSPLTRPFWSQVPYAFGLGDGTIARYSVAPHPGNMLHVLPAEYRDGDYLRRTMIGQLTTAAKPAAFDFCLQLRTDATEAVIDDPTVEWDTPIQKVAAISIPPQDFDRPEQVRFGEGLSYTPWHALPEHRPVGQINRIRRSVYAATSRMRHLFTLTPRREPTSADPPRSTGRLRIALTLAGLFAVVALTIFGAKVWSKLRLDLPEYAAVEKQIWLDQNWSPGAREWYHHANQGGQFPPMINVPYEWFVSLEQPSLSLTASGLLADQHYLDRFGFIPSTAESGAFDWRSCREPEGTAGSGGGYDSGTALAAWRHRLPVGFACSDRRAQPMLQPDGRPWRNPATGGTMGAIGLSCAACHTGRLTYGTTELLVDGGPAMTDIVRLNKAIALSLLATRYLPFRFDRFALRLLGPAANDDSKAALKAQLDAVVKRVLALHALDEKVENHAVTEGYGRLDALNRIGNQVFSIDLDRPANYAGSSAPVHYPRIWDMPWLEWAQYNASIGQPMVRNAGEALGTGAPIVLAGSTSGTALTAPLYTSTVQVRTIFEMEKLLAGKPPNEKDGFTGLRAPKWPADVLGPIDAARAERGSKLYDSLCAHCHMAPTRSPAFWSDANWTEKNAAGERYLRVNTDLNLIPVEEIGTDRAQADDLAARKVDLPAELGITSDGFGEALGQLVGKAIDRWYDSQTPPVPQAMRDEMNGNRPNQVRAPLAYKARPLEGVWAAPPYLHNGSVPTVDALLSPPAERPAKFGLGHREYDPQRLGYRFDEFPGGFAFDTTLRGNFNSGHEFDEGWKKGGPNRSGLIGPRLSPDERSALIEFLKSM